MTSESHRAFPGSDGLHSLFFLLKTSLRYILQHPAQFALGLLGISLGIAVVVAIDVAIASSKRAFSLSVDAVAGEASHRIVGDGFGIDEDIYRQLRVEHGFRSIAPLVETEALRLEPVRGVVKILGVDLYAEAGIRSWTFAQGKGKPGRETRGSWVSELVVSPGTCVISRAHLENLQAQVGDRLTLRIAGRLEQLRIVGILEESTGLDRERFGSIVLTDIATAQELLAEPGKLSQIDVRLTDDAELDRLGSLLPQGVHLEKAGGRQRSLEQMTAAFDLNLRSLSLLALLVGWFLIDNTMAFSVVQRRSVFGRLRTLGVTRRQVFAVVLLEGLAFGIAGAVLGCVLGLILGKALVGVVAGTLGDLYFAVEVNSMAVPVWTLIKGSALGMGACLLAAGGPAREASSSDPRDVLRRSTLEARTQARVGRHAVLGALALSLAGLLLVFPSNRLAVGYASLLLVVVGFVGLAPLSIRLLVLATLSIGGRWLGVVHRYAIRCIDQHLSRTAFAITALSVAIAMAMGVGIMVSSFRGSVADWLEQTLTGDIYVGLQGTVSRQGNQLPLAETLVNRLTTLDGVVGVAAIRRFETATTFGPTEILVRREMGQHRENRQLIAEQEEGDLPAIFASEPLVFRHDLELGDTLEVATGAGLVKFEIVGVFRDYVSDMGYLSLADSVYESYWEDRSTSAMALFLGEEAEVDAVVAAVREAATEVYGEDLAEVGFLASRSADLRRESLRVFDRTFRITDVLRLLATLVAMVGVASAFMALLLERTREFGTLRAAGLTRAGVLHLTTTQSVVMGGIAGALAIPLGVIFAAILTLVVNRRSFGWSLDFFVDPGVVGVGFVTSIVAAVLAGLLPAWRLARLEPAEALRERGE
ncbi:MAG: ABC transporter permease [Deltaproteobacteria bacterium]|nr:ABC transporter permease [Deltaproteobacteria bacterium]